MNEVDNDKFILNFLCQVEWYRGYNSSQVYLYLGLFYCRKTVPGTEKVYRKIIIF